ncbi:hypothetical protein QBC46DRAFT_448920 [Diplogelasinospora grovesii]|uniref:Uncharacterized protein n=1 Tax=Diplogelasinospora grovesii TaxID=303347 RepID=A0AAN6S610_9PEZI|nr:hypothetical protein QBC46DRAFT_448920 [Diplogelasinospora grovesii]
MAGPMAPMRRLWLGTFREMMAISMAGGWFGGHPGVLISCHRRCLPSITSTCSRELVFRRVRSLPIHVITASNPGTNGGHADQHSLSDQDVMSQPYGVAAMGYGYSLHKSHASTQGPCFPSAWCGNVSPSERHGPGPASLRIYVSHIPAQLRGLDGALPFLSQLQLPHLLHAATAQVDGPRKIETCKASWPYAGLRWSTVLRSQLFGIRLHAPFRAEPHGGTGREMLRKGTRSPDLNEAVRNPLQLGHNRPFTGPRPGWGRDQTRRTKATATGPAVARSPGSPGIVMYLVESGKPALKPSCTLHNLKLGSCCGLS